MTINWPSSLSEKALSASGFAEAADVDPTVRSQPDSGPMKSRPRFTAVPKKITGTIDTLSSDETDDLLSFYENDCAFGSLPFVWTHPRSGATVTYKWKEYPQISTADNSPIVFQATISLIIIPS